MRIKSFKITGFRNIKSMEFNPCDNANIIFGDNAQGKTNLLEAIWLFSGAKSFRGAHDAEFTLFGEKFAKLEIEFFAKERNQNAAINFSEDKKTVYLNEIKLESATKFAGEFCTVVFSPDHLSLVKQGPDKRRKLIDTSLCQAYPKYIKILDGYSRALKQRNSLLKDISGHPSLIDTLEAWDVALLDYGAYITSMRARYIKKLAMLAACSYDGISSGNEEFSAVYAPGCGKIDGLDRDVIRKIFCDALNASRSDDIKSGVTNIGPHRDDMEIMLDGKSARVYGSQGQQRSCILALKLAECSILEERNNEPPVILLDDVMSELDHGRRDYLLNRLSGRQTFITCCDAGAFKSLDGGKVFEIKAGSLLSFCKKRETNDAPTDLQPPENESKTE